MATQKKTPAVAAGAAALALQSGAQGPANPVVAAPLALAGFVVKRNLTLPVLNIGQEVQGVIMEVLTNPTMSDVVDKGNQKDPAIVADVKILADVVVAATGEVQHRAGSLARWLIPAVALGNMMKGNVAEGTGYCATQEAADKSAALKKEADALEEKGPRRSKAKEAIAAADLQVKGRVFAMQNLGKRTESQRYWDFNIAELERAGTDKAA